MARRIDGWTDLVAPPLAVAAPVGSAPHGSAPVVDTPDLLAEDATCECADYRRDKVCDHVLMAAAVRMVRRMIDAQKPH
jgi:hypothetical protein